MSSHERAGTSAAKRAAALNPNDARSLGRLGLAAREAGNLQDAMIWFRRATGLAPDDPTALNNLAAAQGESGRIEEAAGTLLHAFELHPRETRLAAALARALLALAARRGEATRFREIVALDPALAKAWFFLAHAERGVDRLDRAEIAARRALTLDPEFHEARCDLAALLEELGRCGESVALSREVLAARPDDAEAHANLGVTLLSIGRFEEGWREYAWRRKARGFPARLLTRPMWDGAPAPGRVAVLRAEQGLGDTIQFVRYAAWARERLGRVIVACPRPLVKLIAGAPGVDLAVGIDERIDGADFDVPLMELPRLHGTDANNIPAPIPYLHAEPERARRFNRLFASVPGFRVGVVWRGNPAHERDRRRSFAVREFAPLAAVPGVRLLGLQRGGAEAELDEPGPGLPIKPLGSRSADFRDLAAALVELDLLVCCDTSVAHAAGALGVPVWCALAAAPDWRWGREGTDTPWYPTMRLYRQTRPGDWSSVFTRMAEDLSRRTTNGADDGSPRRPRRR